MAYLVDTSVWIDFFNDNKNKATEFFAEILEHGITYGITGIIYQEILQGTKSDKDFKQVMEYLHTQRFYSPLEKISSYQSAAQLYFNCRRKGVTLRSTVDCLIAQIAIEHDLILLHNDKDYVNIKRHNPALKLYK